MGIHRALEAAREMEKEGISAEVLDLRTVAPLDAAALRASVGKTGRLLMVEEDYEGFGLSGVAAARLLEAGLTFDYARICTRSTIPFSHDI